MNTLRKFWLAIENLASSLNCLAVTLDSISVQIRERAGIPAEPGPPLLPKSNGQAEPAPVPTERKRRS